MTRELLPLEVIGHQRAHLKESVRGSLSKPCDVATLRYVAQEVSVTVRGVAMRFGLTLAGARNRLVRLTRAKLIEKKRIGDCDAFYVVTDAGREGLRGVES